MTSSTSSNTNGVLFKAMEISSSSFSSDEKDASLRHRLATVFSRHWRTLLWSLVVVAAAIVYIMTTTTSDEVGLLEEEWNQGHQKPARSDNGNSNTGKIDVDVNVNSFPGMDDHTTILECCPARIIVELERAFAANDPLPHSLLMFDGSNSSMCGSYIESIENYPGCCRLPPDKTDDHSFPFGSLTIPDWVDHCVIDDKHDDSGFDNTGFMFYYDDCTGPLLWDTRSCATWMASNVDHASDLDIVQTNLSLVDGTGTFQGTVAVFPSKWPGNHQTNQTSIFVPDVFDSCWQVDCGWHDNVSTEECITFAQQNLVQVTLETYVNITKQVWCE